MACSKEFNASNWYDMKGRQRTAYWAWHKVNGLVYGFRLKTFRIVIIFLYGSYKLLTYAKCFICFLLFDQRIRPGGGDEDLEVKAACRMLKVFFIIDRIISQHS